MPQSSSCYCFPRGRTGEGHQIHTRTAVHIVSRSFTGKPISNFHILSTGAAPEQPEMWPGAQKPLRVLRLVAPIENPWPYLPGRSFQSFQRPRESPQWSLCQMNQESSKMRTSLHCNHLLQSTLKLHHLLDMKSPPSGLPSVLSHPDIPYDQYMVFHTQGHSGPRS